LRKMDNGEKSISFLEKNSYGHIIISPKSSAVAGAKPER